MPCPDLGVGFNETMQHLDPLEKIECMPCPIVAGYFSRTSRSERFGTDGNCVRTAVIISLSMLRDARMAATRKLQCGVPTIGERQVWAEAV